MTERLYYFDNFNKKYPTDKMSFTDIDIAPYQTGVLPALLGIYLYAKHNITIYDLNEIHNYIAVSNYYKFSLNNGQSDINPETEINDFIKDYKEIENYYTINDELVEKEIETLKPDIIISFKGRKLDKLKELVKTNSELIKINDPSWILQGGSGVLKENKSWWNLAMKCNKGEIKDLVNNYLNSLNGRYANKKESVRTYLLKYYCEWK